MTPPSLRNDHRVIEERLLAKRATNCVAVHIWHANVEQDCIRPVFLRCLNSELAFMNQPVVVTYCLKHPADGLRYVDIVVHDQNLQRAHLRCCGGRRFGRAQA